MRRLSVDMPDDLGQKIDRLIDHGYKGQLVVVVLGDLLDIIEKVPREKRALLIGAILSRDVSTMEILKRRWEKDEPV